VQRGGGNGPSSSCALSLGFLALAVESLFDGRKLGQPSKAQDVFVAWKRRMKKGLAFGVWKLIPLASWWSVWKERN